MKLFADVIWLFIAYLAGSIPTAYLVARRARNIDIRAHGSGNVGASNVFRVIGKKWGSLVLAADVLKGFAVVTLLAPGAPALEALSPVLKQLVFGIAAISGHTWTPWLRLKGGKGIATGAGVLIGIFPKAAIATILIWAILFLAKRYVSLASIVASGSFPIILFLFYREINSFWIIFLLSAGLSYLLIYNHRGNIERLKNGTEPRVNLWGSKDSSEPPVT